MAVIVYGDGTKYNAAGAQYGRIGSGLLNAQALRSRQTGLRVSIKDEQLNAWVLHAGTRAYPTTGLGYGLYYPNNGAYKPYEIEHAGARGRSDMAVKANGDIVRVRNGNPADVSDRQLWIQTITDPSTAAQWTSWSVQYSGNHYGSNTIEIAGDGTTVLIYHCKSDGMYRNNSLVINNSSLRTGDKAIYYFPVKGDADRGWLMAVGKDSIDNASRYNLYYVTNAATGAMSWDPLLSLTWKMFYLAAIKDGDTLHCLVSAPLHANTRATSQGQELSYFSKSISTGEMSPFRPIRGIGGGSGVNYITGPRVVRLSDGYYYYTAFEWHRPLIGGGNPATSLGYGFPVWARSKDMMNWSEPVVGPPMTNAWGFIAGLTESEGYVYMADSEEVWRRPIGTVTTDISNYVPELEFEIPRDNQSGTGSVKVANPAGVNNLLQSKSDTEIVIEPGLLTASGQYEYTTFDRFFIQQVNQENQGKVNRLNLTITNLWGRLETTMRDVTNLIGQFVWDDFAANCRNQAFNYFFDSDVNPTVSATTYKMTTDGLVLATMWRGHNPDVTATFSDFTGNPAIIVKYSDIQNYVYAEYNGAAITLKEIAAGVESTIDSTGASGSPTKIRVQIKNCQYKVWYGDVLKLSGSYEWKIRLPGYVGFQGTTFDLSNVHIEDWEYPLYLNELAKLAIAMGDFHDVLITSGTGGKAVAITWGPQTDLSTPADALRSILETEKLQLIWRNNSVEVGRFDDRTVIKTIRDEVIESDIIDEAERRINFVAIDGNEHYWIQVDPEDMKTRGRMVVAYFDLPELLDQASVTNRALEEIKRSAQGSSKGGTTPLFFDLWRMDAVTWVDNEGNSQTVRIEGYSVSINQSTAPHQRQTFDTSPYVENSSGGLMDEGPSIEE